MKQICVFLLFFSMAASAQQKQSLSITLENVEYPYPLNFVSMSIEGQDVRMAYMDIKPANYNWKCLIQDLTFLKSLSGLWREILNKLTYTISEYPRAETKI